MMASDQEYHALYNINDSESYDSFAKNVWFDWQLEQFR